MIWYHFTAVKWYDITSRVSFLFMALSHWYPHIICNKVVFSSAFFTAPFCSSFLFPPLRFSSVPSYSLPFSPLLFPSLFFFSLPFSSLVFFFFLLCASLLLSSILFPSLPFSPLLFSFLLSSTQLFAALTTAIQATLYKRHEISPSVPSRHQYQGKSSFRLPKEKWFSVCQHIGQPSRKLQTFYPDL